MKCPYCGIEIYWDSRTIARSNLTSTLKGDNAVSYEAESGFCPGCEGFIVNLIRSEYNIYEGADLEMQSEIIGEPETVTVRPKSAFREPCPLEVPEDVAADYNEACAVIDISPTAAAALARRCSRARQGF